MARELASLVVSAKSVSVWCLLMLFGLVGEGLTFRRKVERKVVEGRGEGGGREGWRRNDKWTGGRRRRGKGEALAKGLSCQAQGGDEAEGFEDLLPLSLAANLRSDGRRRRADGRTSETTIAAA